MAIKVNLHYPELRDPRLEPARNVTPEITGFSQSLKQGLRDFTQRLNAEFRIIVDQIASIASKVPAEPLTGTLSPEPDGANLEFLLPREARTIMVFSQDTGTRVLKLLLAGDPFNDYTFLAGTNKVIFATAPLTTDWLTYVILA